MTEWKDVVGFEGLYKISNDGQIFSVRKNLIMTPKTGSKYIMAFLYKNGKRTARSVHTLMLEAFVGPRPKGYDGCRTNGNHLDNRINNLRWDSRSNNLMDRRKHGTSRSKAIIRSDGVVYESMQDVRQDGFETANVWKVCKGLLETSGGYGWSYK